MTTYQSISLEILQDLLEPLVCDIVVESLLKEKVLRDRYGSLLDPKPLNSDGELSNRMDIVDNKLVFAGAQLRSSNISKPSNGGSQTTNGSGANGANGDYFQCSNCDRKIAGSRFAAHLDKCLGGRSRK